MFGSKLKATNSSFQKSVIYCLNIYVKKVMKLLAFIFEQPSYLISAKYSALGDLTVPSVHVTSRRTKREVKLENNKWV